MEGLPEAFGLSRIDGNVTVIRFEPSCALTLGSQSRALQILRIVKMQLKHFKGSKIKQGPLSIEADFQSPVAEIDSIIEALVLRLEDFRRDKLPAKIVEEVLGISSRECRRWTKDGRLRQSAANFILRGRNKIKLSAYEFDEIARLVKSPHIIETWRKADQKSDGK